MNFRTESASINGKFNIFTLKSLKHRGSRGLKGLRIQYFRNYRWRHLRQFCVFPTISKKVRSLFFAFRSSLASMVFKKLQKVMLNFTFWEPPLLIRTQMTSSPTRLYIYRGYLRLRPARKTNSLLMQLSLVSVYPTRDISSTKMFNFGQNTSFCWLYEAHDHL